MTTVILDYGMGNLRSIAAACDRVGIRDHMLSWGSADIRKADALILPGVGAFSTAIRTLSDLAFIEPIRDYAKSGRPLLGICLGMQLLMDMSEEGKEAEGPSCVGYHGIGLIPGTVRRLPDQGDPIPHVGWHNVRPASGISWDGTPLATTAPATPFYFSHSYRCHPTDPAHWQAMTDFGAHNNPYDIGETSFPSAIRAGNVFGVQFHPEKSGEAGLAVFAEFARMVKGREMAA